MALHTYEEQEEQIKYDITDAGERIVVEQPGSASKSQASGEIDHAEVLGGEENLAATEDEVGNVRSQLREIQVKVK